MHLGSDLAWSAGPTWPLFLDNTGETLWDYLIWPCGERGERVVGSIRGGGLKCLRRDRRAADFL